VGAKIVDIQELGPFDFRWPDATEHFDSGWSARLLVNGEDHPVTHRVGGREVYGRNRVHTVTWLDGTVQVEGVEADDYPTTQALLSVLRKDGKTHVKAFTDVPTDYADFQIVEHRREIDAKWSRYSLAVKIREDDLLRWGVHAWLRSRSRHQRVPAVPPKHLLTLPPLAAPPTLERQAVAGALLSHGDVLAQTLGGGTARLTPDARANELILTDHFAFLIAVICGQGILAERAWAIPFELKRRLGHLDPHRFADEPASVVDAFSQSPKLHRFVNQIAAWASDGGRIVVERYGGDTQRLWNDSPAAAELRQRFDASPGSARRRQQWRLRSSSETSASR